MGSGLGGVTTQQIHLRRRAEGLPKETDFRLVDARLPPLRDGQILVENLWMSIDPYMRRNMGAEAGDLVPWPLDAPLDGPSIGRVVESMHPGFAVGDLVESMSGWQRHFISDGEPLVHYLSPNTNVLLRHYPDAHPKDHVGILGVAAMTGYAGMACLADCEPGWTAVVSSGAGTVGSVACQIGLIRGFRVVSSAGTAEKVAWLKETLGVHEAFNYREVDLPAALRAACPNGIDLLLENATAVHMSACLPLMNDLRQILIAGFVGLYTTDGKVPPFPNFEHVLDRFLTIRAYRFMDWLDAYPRFVSDMLNWRREGRMRFEETHLHGLEQAPAALCSLFSHQVRGKLLVRIAEDG